MNELKTILVADTDVSIRQFLKIRLSHLGYNVIIATTGEEVFSASKKTEKAVDAAASVTVIDSKTIENRPTNNVTQLLDNVVGLTLDRQGANRYNITLRDSCLLYTSPSPRDATLSRMPSSA